MYEPRTQYYARLQREDTLRGMLWKLMGREKVQAGDVSYRFKHTLKSQPIRDEHKESLRLIALHTPGQDYYDLDGVVNSNLTLRHLTNI